MQLRVSLFETSFPALCHRVQVETPGSYGSLEEYFTHYQSPRHSSNQSPCHSSHMSPRHSNSSVPRPLHNGEHGNSFNQSSTPEVCTNFLCLSLTSQPEEMWTSIFTSIILSLTECRFPATTGGSPSGSHYSIPPVLWPAYLCSLETGSTQKESSHLFSSSHRCRLLQRYSTTPLLRHTFYTVASNSGQLYHLTVSIPWV